jgi:phasin family protein
MAQNPESKLGQAFPGFAEFTNMLSRMQLPAMPDMDAVLASYRKNMETLGEANRVAMEGAQAVARRNMEIMRQSMSDLTEAMKALANADAPQAKAAKQAELAKTAYERAVANMKEISDLIQKSNSEALALLNQRFAEAMEEVKALVSKKTA